jgi:hypothetical protein
MSRPNSFLFALYRGALQLYPSRLRQLYQDQMLQTVRDADEERSYSALYFWLYLFGDLFRSCVNEHLFMIRKQIIAHPIFFHTFTLGLILTLFGFPAAMSLNGMFRRTANEPQTEIARQYASRLADGEQLEDVIPARRVDLQQSLEPFAIFYNNQGIPIGGNGYLNQTLQRPPAGVFAYLRAHGNDTITWQPKPGVRIAAVMLRVAGPNPGFLLTGRSLRAVEQQESTLRKMVYGGWFFLMVMLIAGAFVLNLIQTVGPKPAASQG